MILLLKKLNFEAQGFYFKARIKLTNLLGQANVSKNVHI